MTNDDFKAAARPAGELLPPQRPLWEISREEAEAIAWAVQWAGHFATIVGDCKPNGPALSHIAAATRAMERAGLRIYHSIATRALIEATR
jgi:hypothetical protein